jgi:SAM-dependent methyltransferase
VPTALHEERLDRIVREVRASEAASVLDLGCGTGELMMRLAREPGVTRLVGLEIDPVARAVARSALGLGLDAPGGRVEVRNGSFADRHADLVGFDAAVLLETIEHIDPALLSRVERAIFGGMRPRHIWVTTPNVEYNVLHGLGPGERRHPGHRFEWDRAKFRRWAEGVGERHGYTVTMGAIGPTDRLRGSSTQMARFARQGAG